MNLTHTAIPLLCLGAVCAIGCSAPQAGAAMTSPTASAPIDDTELTEQLEQGAQLLLEGGRTVPMKTLIAQLQRSSANVATLRSSATPLSNRALYERARKAVLVIGNMYKCGKCDKWHVGQSSGFAISADGIVVTNHHVVDRPDNATLVAMTADGQVYPVVEVLAASKTDDLAIVRVKANNLTPLPVATDVSPGDRVRVVSHPDGFLWTLTSGIVSRIFAGKRHGQRTPVLQITADFAKGSSGAPVINDAGAVVGVVSYTRSIHHDNVPQHKRNLQMVLKNCTPASQIHALLSAP